MTPLDIISKINNQYHLVEYGRIVDVFMTNHYNPDPQLLCSFDNKYDAETFKQRMERNNQKYFDLLSHYDETWTKDQFLDCDYFDKNLYYTNIIADGKGVVIKNGEPFIVVESLQVADNLIKNLKVIDDSYQELSTLIQNDLIEYYHREDWTDNSNLFSNSIH